MPHLALLVLLLLGTRSSSLLALALLLMGTLLATLHARGLRVVMRMDGAGRLGLAVIRHGGPVEGLGPGESWHVMTGVRWQQGPAVELSEPQQQQQRSS